MIPQQSHPERNPDCGGVTAGALKKVQVHVLRVSPLSDNPRVRRERSAADLLPPPEGCDPTPLNMPARPHRRDLLGGLIHEYEAA